MSGGEEVIVSLTYRLLLEYSFQLKHHQQPQSGCSVLLETSSHPREPNYVTPISLFSFIKQMKVKKVSTNYLFDEEMEERQVEGGEEEEEEEEDEMEEMEDEDEADEDMEDDEDRYII
ncbi:hypothetical protein BGZ76_006329 [Entomortierella beljakovae]|nr:hypothetical protein BGZ76_006329 [Entomortierella beljakovae]